MDTESSRSIVEVQVVPGPNTKSPVFQQSIYETVVSEGVPINTTVLVVKVSRLQHLINNICTRFSSD